MILMPLSHLEDGGSKVFRNDGILEDLDLKLIFLTWLNFLDFDSSNFKIMTRYLK